MIGTAPRDRKTPEGKAAFAAYMREYRKVQPNYRKRERERFLWRSYGITAEEYDALRDAQAGRCAACGVEGGPPLVNAGAATRVLQVDHDHTTGRVRGLLCRLCNIALGHVGEDPDRLRALADYLEMP
jgi:hypothetical protein